MKKRITTLLLIFFLISGVAMAEDGYIYLGHCNGEVNTTGTGKPGAGFVEAAIKIKKRDLSIYEDCQIKQIRVGLAHWYKDLRPDTLTVWLRDSLNGENIIEGRTTELQPGEWNTIELDSVYDIVAKGDLYIGFSYYQTTKNNIISLAGYTSEAGTGCCYIAKNGKWTDYAGRDGFGILSVEAVVTGDNLPKYNLALNVCEASHITVKYGEEAPITGIVESIGAFKANGYNINYTINDSIKGTFHIKDTLSYRDLSMFEIGLPTKEIDFKEGMLDVVIDITFAEDSVVDQFLDNNSRSFPIAMYETAFERKVLIEQFTTEGCTNCPPASKRIKAALTKEYDGKYVRLAHHVGYGVDFLTVDESEDYIWFYGHPSNQFAPALMFNRHYNPNETADNYPIQQIGDSTDVRESLDFELADPAFVTVDIKTEVDNDKVTVTVSGERHELLKGLSQNTCLSVYVKESGIPIYKQFGVMPDDEYTHDYALRRVLSNVWGDVITWEGNSYTATYTTTFPTEWNYNNTQIVAIVHNYNANDIFDCVVFNANESPLGAITAIDEVNNDSDVVESIYYTLQGIALPGEPENDGIYIRQDRHSNGTISTIKTLIKQ